MGALARAVNGRNLWVIPLLLGIVVVLAPWLGAGNADLRQLTLIALLAMSASGLNLAWGYGGELAVGQIVMYCVGAYVTGYLAVEGYDMVVGMLASVLAAAALGAVVALPSLRLGGWGLAIASFFLVLLIPPTLNLFEEQTGGLVGMLGIPAPVLFGQELGSNAFYVVLMVCAVAWFVLMRNLVTSRHGAALRVVRESSVLAGALGLSVIRVKATAYILGAIPAGLAGSMFVYVDRFLAPDYFDFAATTLIIAASVIGGLETVYGAVIGAAILTVASREIGTFDNFADIVYGAFLVGGGVLLANTKLRTALANLRRRVRHWRVPARESLAAADPALPPVAGLVLTATGVSKSFGKNVALTNVSVEAKPGAITALIGANGSGKTTLLNIMSGFYRPDSGVVAVDGSPLPVGRPAKTARRGLSRTFQTPLVPQSLTVLEVVALARSGKDRLGILPAMLRLPRYWRVRRRDRQEASDWLAAVGLARHNEELASSLPLGSRRLIEVARALSSGSGVLLLDEPASGLDLADVDAFAALLRRLRDAGATIVLVDHNFGLVCDIADTIYVLERGEVISHGDADHVRSDEAVARSYLGKGFGSADALAPDTEPTESAV